MAYGLKYTGYKQRGTDRVTVNIYAKDWTGTSYELATLTALSLQIQGAQGTPYSPLIKTSVAIALRDAFDEGSTASDGTTCVKDGGKWGQWEEFYTNDSTKFRVELLHGSTVIWKGYITPDSWGEDMTYRGVINLTARDMLGTLSEKEFDLTGTVSIRDIVNGAMTAGDVPMTVSFEDDECLVNSNGENILNATVQASVFGGKSWQQALEQTLEALGLVLRYDGQGGLYVTSLRYAYTHATGTATPLFTGGSGYRSLDPAVRQIVDVFDPKFENYESEDPATSRFLVQTGTYDQTYRVGTQTVTYHSLRKYQVSADASGNGWRGDLATLPAVAVTGRPELNLCIPTDCDNPGYIEYRDNAVFLPIAVTVDAMLINTGTTWTIEQSSTFAVKTISLQIRATVSGQTRYLTDVGTWSAVESTLSIAAREKLVIPELAGATGLAIRILKVETECKALPYHPLVAAPILTFSAPEYSDLAGEYKTTTVYNESNHVEINRKPEIGSANTTLAPVIASNILAFDGVAAHDEWGFSDMNGHYPLAVMVQAQLLVLYAAQNGNSVFTGSFIQSDKRTALPGKDYTYYQRDCAMLAGTFDFISGTAQSVTLREIAQWSDIWDTFAPDYTQKESAQAGGTAASGGGTSGGGGGQGGGGSVTSVALAMPAGFSVEGSPITRNGELRVGFSEGYGLLTPEARAILDRFEYDADTHTLIVKKDGGNDVNFAAYGEVSAGGIGQGGGGGGGLIQNVYGYTDLGGTYSDSDKTNTFNAYTTARLARRITTLEGKATAVSYTPSVSSGTALGTITIDNVGHTIYAPTIPTSLKNPYSLIFGSKTYDGSAAKTITASDLGALTSHQTVTLASGTNNGTLKITTAAGTVDNIAVKGLGSLAYLNGLSKGDVGLGNVDNTADANKSVAYAANAGQLGGKSASNYFVNNNNRGAVDFDTQFINGFEYVSGSSTHGGRPYAILFTAVTGDAGIQVNWGRDYALQYRSYSGVGWYNWRTVYDSGNLTAATLGAETTAHAAATYLPLSGGTITGALNLYTVSETQGGNETRIQLTSDGPGGDLCAIYEMKSVGNGMVFAEANRDFIWRTGSGSISGGGGTEVFRITNGGNVLIGTTTNIGEKLYVAGNIVATGEITAGSDSRWKDNQTPVLNGIDIIRQLRPMTWTWNEQFAEKNYIGKQSAGLIAQQVASVLPFAVRGNQENGFTLDYNVFHAYEISAIQHHETRIERLERENAELKRQLQQLNS